ncbi:phosphatase PAP2 family protein [Solirubrobacter phytolaccae]|uniref:Phosphatase PAP2 family protein n=1 Tax=Solirubrobacter phytolaccae TaxID=1404360 RepID=A0A9X3NDE1_9ACTN|nr:phosphatase PAP2 family protein [Solirubrobacter phytolaccae]MDA0184034.1 phosphatase PAP2 family protein [Solirubrobacter phytolaccae]
MQLLRRPGLRELALFAFAYLLYNAGRWATNGDVDLALSNARWLVEFQGGIGVERAVQHALDTPVVEWLLSHVYLAAQIVVLPAALLAFYRWRPAVYRPLRNTVIVTWMLALVVYALFPVAPPRLAGVGLTDWVSEQSAVALAGHSTMFYNPIAAVPSLHCGFAFALSVAGAAATTRPWLRALALLWGPLVALSTVATGNHFVFDVVAGLAVTLLGAVIAWTAQHPPRLHRHGFREATTVGS